MAVLQAAGQRFLATLDREELLWQAAHIISDYFGHQRIALALIDEEEKLVWMVPVRSYGQLLPKDAPIDESSSCGWVAKTGQSLLINDTEAEQRWRTASLFLGTRSELTVAIPGAGRVSGVIAIQSPVPDGFERDDLALLETLASQLGLALENARLYAHALRRASDLALIHDVQRVLESSMDLELILQQVASTIIRALGYAMAQICLIYGDQLVLVSDGTTTDEEINWIHELDTKSIEALAQDDGHVWSLLAQHSQFSVPLKQSERILGVLNIAAGPGRRLEQDDLRVIAEVADRIALAVDRALLFAEVQSTAEREMLFSQIVASLRRSLDSREIASIVCRELGAALKVDRCGVSLLHQETSELISMASYSASDLPALPDVLQLIEADLLFLSQLRGEGSPLGVLNDSATQDSPLAQYMRRHGMRSGMLVTLPLDDGSIGLLTLFHYEQPRLWTPHTQRLVSDVAVQLTLALRQAHLYAAEQQRRRELETLQEVISTISEAGSIEILLNMVSGKAAELFDAPSASVLMRYEEGHEEMRFFPGYGLPADFGLHERVRREQVGELIQRFPPPQPFLLSDLASASLPIFDQLSAYGLRSIFGQPLIMDGVPEGWLLIGSKDPARTFGAGEQRLAAALAQQMVMAAHKLRRYQREVLLRAAVEESYNDAKAVLEELERTKDHLIRSEKQRALGELASGVAHDFNNLLAAILGNVQMLLSEESDPERLEMLQIIEQVSRDGATIVRRIQDFARSQETAYDEVVDIKALALSALDIARPAWRNKAQRMGVAIDVTLELEPAPVLGSAAELREVVVNLLLNAAYAMPEGGTLRIRTGRRGNEVFLFVQDSGVGIKPEDRPRIWDPFFTTKPVGSGSGLGLSIALSIVQRHRGAMDLLESSPGQGSTFFVLLPLHDQEMSAIVAPEEPVAAPGLKVQRRILVVDDEKTVRHTLEQQLQRDGHEVMTAGSGPEALELLAREPFDLIFSDLGMPGMTGWDFLAVVRERYPLIKTVLITGWGYQVEVQDAHERSVDLILSKPFDQHTIAQAVLKLCASAEQAA